MLQDHFAIDQFVGESEWTRRVRKRILQIANYNYSVLITGPSGTGKELVARAVHTHGTRATRPFIPVNCAAIPGGLFSSQLFGHVKGAFTGAQFAALGCFRAADGGTIFLDEIGDLDLDCQAKLLRVLQEKKVTPVGGHDGVDINVRTIAATNRNLAEDVKSGRFRLDLFYRLNVLSVETKGLRERVHDIEPLVRHFLAKATVECGVPLKKMSPAALELLKLYDWPGNVRELENVMEQVVVLAEQDTIDEEVLRDVLPRHETETAPLPGGYLPAAVPPAGVPGPCPASPPGNHHLEAGPHRDWPTLTEVEARHIAHTLKETFYNQSAAARLLGIDRKMLARKIRKYEIPMPRAAASRRHPATCPLSRDPRTVARAV